MLTIAWILMPQNPYYLMFRGEPNLPIVIEFGVRTPDVIATSTKSYVEKLQMTCLGL